MSEKITITLEGNGSKNTVIYEQKDNIVFDTMFYQWFFDALTAVGAGSVSKELQK